MRLFFDIPADKLALSWPSCIAFPVCDMMNTGEFHADS